MRKYNAKMATAIRNVKQNPDLVQMISGIDMDTMIEQNVKSDELHKIQNDI